MRETSKRASFGKKQCLKERSRKESERRRRIEGRPAAAGREERMESRERGKKGMDSKDAG